MQRVAVWLRASAIGPGSPRANETPLRSQALTKRENRLFLPGLARTIAASA